MYELDQIIRLKDIRIMFMQGGWERDLAGDVHNGESSNRSPVPTYTSRSCCSSHPEDICYLINIHSLLSLPFLLSSEKSSDTVISLLPFRFLSEIYWGPWAAALHNHSNALSIQHRKYIFMSVIINLHTHTHTHVWLYRLKVCNPLVILSCPFYH